MSMYQDRQIRGYGFFLIFFMLLSGCVGVLCGLRQLDSVKAMYLRHDEAVVTALLEQGVPGEVIAGAMNHSEVSEEGRALLGAAGIDTGTNTDRMPFIAGLQQDMIWMWAASALFLWLVMTAGTALFYRRRKHLYEQAAKVLAAYIDGDYAEHLPQNSEGGIYHIFSSVEQLATMLQSKNETEHQSREFLKNTISDISHQLKTPLAAMSMYQEIIAAEPEHSDTVRCFSAKMGEALKRMEALIQAMLKITRLDTGNIVFAREACTMGELVERAIGELAFRAQCEEKMLSVEGDRGLQLICDRDWTAQAIGNIVKNALDHTKPGGSIRIFWEQSPVMLRILISDNGSGIAAEDIHHIFKRFYRSRYSLDTQGIGLGLPLAKAIVEGQGGVISVQSEVGEGTTFAISFLTES